MENITTISRPAPFPIWEGRGDRSLPNPVFVGDDCTAGVFAQIVDEEITVGQIQPKWLNSGFTMLDLGEMPKAKEATAV